MIEGVATAVVLSWMLDLGLIVVSFIVATFVSEVFIARRLADPRSAAGREAALPRILVNDVTAYLVVAPVVGVITITLSALALKLIGPDVSAFVAGAAAGTALGTGAALYRYAVQTA